MRADAAQRRETILRQARHLFAERGRDVALETIAAASGVGIATLYRNFSSREELVRAVVDDMVQEILTIVAAARTTADKDPAEAWKGLLGALTDMELGALTDVLGLESPQDSHAVFAAIQQPALDALDELLIVLQHEKAVRTGLTALDVVVAVATITRLQVPAIREAAPGVPEQLAEAYLLWSRAG
ncbi:helix-turn-helix domain-containing protein [Arthrobacter sp. APC 3897]|uniref:TetR/AcrR family transcriptional regulator n=1 Tax=Arthrobacter sp. APC 3897 TaxID=3035204 RepID=UPI0025B448FD|nr:TetR/AcrR family transcriptional regulator [Arthrobacter sp. APC 3897]MDN3482215.1 helix-turn-helix domain-containing protein [Arthrobacter sp. APC 3897]